MPRARSKAIEPVGMASMGTTAPFWPSFMIVPLPNCFSIWESAASMALWRDDDLSSLSAALAASASRAVSFLTMSVRSLSTFVLPIRPSLIP